MEQKLIVACEDIYGLDIYMMIEAINARSLQTNSNLYKVIGFISDEENVFGRITPPAPVLGRITDWEVDDSVKLVMGLRTPKKKEAAVSILKSKGAVFETLIAPWTLLPFEFEVGEGCIIGNYSCKYKSKFGNFVTLDTVMCETVEVGDYSTLLPFVNLTNSKVGKGVYIGSHSVVMMDKTVGDESYIFPGSIVVKNLKPGSVVGGIPATSSGAKNWK